MLKVYAQEVPATYASDFKIVLESAKKYFKGDLSGNPKLVADKDFDQEYACKNKFQGAVVSRLVTDKDGIVNHHVQFAAGNNKEAALQVLTKYVETTKPLLPPNYKESDNVIMRFVNSRGFVYEFNSEVFAEVSKKPTITIGLVQAGENYLVDICIMAPSFSFD